jgi:predicted phage gp36 major capsid-like protein
MNWKLKFATQNEELLFVVLCILTGLLLISFIRIILLLRQRRHMEERSEKLEKQILDQQKSILDIRSDANAWRGEMQRQFDAFRAESAKRLDDADVRAADSLNRLDIANEQHERRVLELQASLDAAERMCSELPSAKARIIELERLLAEESPDAFEHAVPSFCEEQMEELAAATKAVSSHGSLPMLPSMETLLSQPSATEPAPDESVSQLQQRNAELQRALVLARRRKPATRAKPRGR